MAFNFATFLQRSTILNSLFCLIPLSFIAGNLILNVNIVLLIIFSLIFFKDEIKAHKFDSLEKLLIIFFIFTIFTALVNNIHIHFIDKEHENRVVIPKTLAFLRYMLLFFVVKFLVENKIIKFRFFFISCSILSLFVSIDIFYQYIFGKDIFGFEAVNRKLSGPFGDELIAGSYLQRFSFFSFFLVPIFFKIKSKKYLFFLIPFLFLIYFSAMILAGNRMSLILFLFISLLVIIFEKSTRKYFFIFSLVAPVIFFSVISLNQQIQTNFKVFYNQIINIPEIIFSEKITNKEISENYNLPSHVKEFKTFYHTWLMNKYIGGGIKSFRRNCHDRASIDKTTDFICNMHPHNYYLEILADLGVIGFLIISIIFLIIFIKSFVKKYFFSSSLKSMHVITPFIFLYIAEIFPLKSTGSIWTTGNATYLFLIMAIIVGLTKLKELN
jgi:O-antigen ligase